ncbi:hypothetical protein [Nitrospina gracilis]|uniref:hypothetical protein n=1 Tax=Nitrospina gracilis TaxID=35801 RepID=UPI001F28BCDA|nr:hypothetical protein [Nitrospina gracilis]MCF8719242.1 hypothetical protein [Nitrospina gracilis Nb-211]
MLKIPDCIRRQLLLWAMRHMQRRQADVVIEKDYLSRWWVFKSPWLRVYLHKVHRSDRDRALHDHPWHNASLILSGAYEEILWGGSRALGPGCLVLRRATFRHRLVVVRGPVVSLFVTGPKIREWGFWPFIAGSHGRRRWVHWKDFVKPDNYQMAERAAE